MSLPIVEGPSPWSKPDSFRFNLIVTRDFHRTERYQCAPPKNHVPTQTLEDTHIFVFQKMLFQECPNVEINDTKRNKLAENQDQLTSAERAMSKGVRPLEDSTFLSTPYFKSNASTLKLPSLASNLKLDIFHGKRSAGFMLIPCDQVAARCTGYTTCDVENKQKQPVQHNRKGVRTHR